MNKTIVFASMLVLGLMAHAQGLGICTGMLAGTVGLSVPDATGKPLTITAGAVPYVFGAAECQCGDSVPTAGDINVEIKLTSALPIGTAGTAELWVGAGCDDYATRTAANESVCEKVAVLDINELTTASSSAGVIELPLPAKALFSPVKHDCSAPTAFNGVYLIVYTDPTSPFATCALGGLTEQSQAPPPPTNVTATVDDAGMVSLAWILPPLGSFNQAGFQVLCTPTGALAQPAAFSTCDDGVLHRRALSLDATPGVTAGAGAAIACSPVLNAITDSAKIGPITQATTIQVASLDNYGNVARSVSIDVAPPSPAQPELSHGCSVGGDGSPSPWMAAFVLLALALGARRRLHR